MYISQEILEYGGDFILSGFISKYQLIKSFICRSCLTVLDWSCIDEVGSFQSNLGSTIIDNFLLQFL